MMLRFSAHSHTLFMLINTVKSLCHNEKVVIEVEEETK